MQCSRSNRSYRFSNKLSSSISSSLSLNKIVFDIDNENKTVENYSDNTTLKFDLVKDQLLANTIDLEKDKIYQDNFLKLKHNKEEAIYNKENDTSDNESYLKFYRYKYLSEPDENINFDLFSSNLK